MRSLLAAVRLLMKVVAIEGGRQDERWDEADRGATGRGGTGQAAGVEARDGTRGGAGRGGARRLARRGATVRSFLLLPLSFLFPTLLCPFPLVLNCRQTITRCALSYFAILSAVFFHSPYSSSFPAGVEGRDERRGGTGWGGEDQDKRRGGMGHGGTGQLAGGAWQEDRRGRVGRGEQQTRRGGQ